MSYAILAVIMLIMVAIGVCLIAYAHYLHEQTNDIAEQIIREHQKEIEELKKRRYYE
jgi:predicted PurR-regulated permease PerM